MRCLAIVVAFTATVIGQEPGSSTTEEQTKKRAAAVARGRAEADAEIASGKASIWTYGLRNFSHFIESVDHETGLYYSEFGCVIDEELVARVEGHNAAIAEHIQRHGLPKDSLKPWVKELFGLEEFFTSRSKNQKPLRLTFGGDAAVSPDGEFALKLVRRPDRTLEGKPSESTWIVVGDQDIESKRIGPLEMKDPELFWGPKGSWFAVLRGSDSLSDHKDYLAVDLRKLRIISLHCGQRHSPAK
jgi:hypothetical protein